MRNIVGQIATKQNFYPRKKTLEAINRNLEAGTNMQLVAPRRVGKSSILCHLQDTPPTGCICLYIEVESARNANDFFRKICKEIIRKLNEPNYVEQIKGKINPFLSRLKGIKIGGFGIELNDSEEEIDYREELQNFLLGLNTDNNKLVLMIDEFPEVILNILEDDGGDSRNARLFLQVNRELRNHPDLREKVRFIYTGSNSLNQTVANFDSTALINDLNSISVDPLTEAEARDFTRSILTTYDYSISDSSLTYALKAIEYYIPFYLQLLIQEIIYITDGPDSEISETVIDKAIQRAIDQRNDNFFDHYIKRLKRVFPADQAESGILLLKHLSAQSAAPEGELFGIVSYQIPDEKTFRKILKTLKDEGYIKNEGPNYQFNSPILKKWWYNHEC